MVFFFFSKFKEYYDDFVVLLNILILGGCGEQIGFGKKCCCALQSEGKGSVSFLKDLLFSSLYHKRQGDLTLVLFDTLSQDIAVEINMGQLHRVPARRLGK